MNKTALSHFLLAATLCAADSARIASVEQGLTRRINIEGQPQVHWTIAERQKHHKVPAISVAVINDGKIEWAKAYGDGVTTHTRFQAASISKPVAAVTALQLVAQGKLSLDEKVNKKLKSVQIPENKWGKPVTLRQLLSHTAGLTVHGFPGYEKTVPLPTLVQIVKGEKPANTAAVVVDVEPGSIYRYSGGGYQYVQILIEDVTGQPFAAAAKKYVLDPAKMADSGYDQPKESAAAPAYDSKGQPVAGGWNIYPEQTAAGLWTTPSDLARFLLAMSSSKLLPEALTKEALTPIKGGYGLGFGMEGSGPAETFGHGGSNRGYRCQAMLYRNGRQGAVVMTNSDNGDAIVGEITRAVANAYDWPSRKPTTHKMITLPEGQLDALAGAYQGPGLKLEISRNGNGLRVAVRDRLVDFVPESESRFIPLDDGAPSLVFEKDSNGIVVLKAGGGTFKKL